MTMTHEQLLQIARNTAAIIDRQRLTIGDGIRVFFGFVIGLILLNLLILGVLFALGILGAVIEGAQR